MKRFNRPIATGIKNPAFARYGPKQTQVGTRLDTFRVAVGALKAVYGSKAAWAAIRMARKVSKRKNKP